jgi:crotonobetainyl-CoA:carnitine CoA-transferase CaiB-like acyl-CoA transferase
LIAHFRGQTTEHWIKTLDKAGVPCGKVNNVQEALDYSQSIEYGSLRQSSYEGVPVKVLATPLWFDDETEHPVRPAPSLGQDTAQVLGELLGYDSDAIARLSASEGEL